LLFPAKRFGCRIRSGARLLNHRTESRITTILAYALRIFMPIESSHVLTPPPDRPFIPAGAPTPRKVKKDNPRPKAQPQLRRAPDFTSPTFGLFHRAKEGRGVHLSETLVFFLLGLTGVISIGLAFFGI
jgi:hypothetical protein